MLLILSDLINPLSFSITSDSLSHNKSLRYAIIERCAIGLLIFNLNLNLVLIGHAFCRNFVGPK